MNDPIIACICVTTVVLVVHNACMHIITTNATLDAIDKLRRDLAKSDKQAGVVILEDLSSKNGYRTNQYRTNRNPNP